MRSSSGHTRSSRCTFITPSPALIRRSSNHTECRTALVCEMNERSEGNREDVNDWMKVPGQPKFKAQSYTSIKHLGYCGFEKLERGKQLKVCAPGYFYCANRVTPVIVPSSRIFVTFLLLTEYGVRSRGSLYSVYFQ